MSEALTRDLEQRVRDHDCVALAELVELQRGKLMVALERKVGAGLRRRLDLEDILQEIVTRAVRDLPHVDFGDQSPIGWLYQVMDRQIVDLHRYHFEAKKRDAGREISADRPLGDSDSGGAFANLLIASMTTPSAAVSRDFKMVRIYTALEGLSEEMRNAIRWRYLDSLPSQEIAMRLGKTDVATRVLLSRAIRKLKDALSEC
jgi:RNA polymerase sigma-70 factor (ECF subfamily)